MISYLQAIDVIRTFALNHYFINKFDFEFREQMPNLATLDEAYPLLFVVPIASDTIQNVNEFDIDVYCVDRYQKDRTNVNFVISDCNQTLNDLVLWLEEGQDSIEIVSTSTQTPINNDLLDYVGGWVLRLRLQVEKIGLCEIPFKGETPPTPPSCPSGFIRNSDDSFTAIVPSGGELILENITLQTFNSKENLIDEIRNPSNVNFEYRIPDTIIVNSNNTYQLDAPSCDTSVLPDTQIVLKDTDENIISTTDFPSCESYDLTAPDGAITINGSSVGSVKSNGTRTLSVKLDGINSGTFDGFDTWNLTSEWVRPTDWLPIPTIETGEQVFYGLFAVYNVTLGNYLAFSFAGNYTVDWGDGTPIENFTSGTVATHRFDWVNVGNVTSGGWRQALVKVTPQLGQNITVINLQQFHPTIGTGRNQQFMDIVINAPNVSGTNLTLYSNTIATNRVVERVWIREIGLLTSTLSMFSNCSSVQSVPLFNTSAVTNMASMFINCYSIKNIPLFNTISVGNMTSMFNSCFSLQSVPLFNTSAVTNMTSMFSNCFSLQALPLFNTSAVTNMTSMFNGCYSLQAVPLFITNSVTNTTNMFNSCTSLSIVSFTTTALTTTTNMFNSCISIQRTILTGLTRGVSLLNCQMSATELNSFFTALGTASGAQTITVTGNPGASTCNTSIATTKGFTVVI
jgi:surface protein